MSDDDFMLLLHEPWVSDGPAFCMMNNGNDQARSPPVAGSGDMVSPVAMITQPRASSALVR